MQTSKWGPPVWEFLHTIAYNYPLKPKKQDMLNYKFFYEHLGQMLPCKYCRQSYQKFNRELPIDPFLDCREGVVTWIYLIHNKVNHKLRLQGYPISDDPTLEEVNEKYENWRAKCGKVPGRSGGTCRIPIRSNRVVNGKRYIVKE